MMNTVAVVDYGMGNLQSVAQAMRYVAAQVSGAQVLITADPEQVRGADRVLLPGQGALPDCMQELRHSGLLQAVLEAAASKPLFGICVGMQMLFQNSQESLAAQPTPGLGVLTARCCAFSWKVCGKPMEPVTKCHKWGGIKSFKPIPTLCGGGCPTVLITILPTVFLPNRLMRATMQGKASTEFALLRRFVAITFLQLSFTLKKVPTVAWPYIVIFCPGTPKGQALDGALFWRTTTL